MQQGTEKNRLTFRLDDPRLFDLIATQHIPPGPGPELMSDAGRPHSGGHDAR
jgi:cytochrome o ubiquinol oxidase subunit 2